MTAKELRKKYIDFFVERGHKEIPSASLIPENDPTALFISAGMHPLVPYLLGEPHPMGKRLVDVQKCLRVNDIEEVGDTFHHTFLEMLGNWSLGDYWKEEAIEWSYQFLTEELNLEPERLSVTCFAGDKDAPRDKESAKVWLSLGIPKQRIYFLGKKDNWWGPVGETGPCGPDTEIFYDTGRKPCSPGCKPGCSCGKYFEIWNNVFMEFNKKGDRRQATGDTKKKECKYEILKQKNVDTGMGVERTVAILQGRDDNYQTELFIPIIQRIEKVSGKKYLNLIPSKKRCGRTLNRKDWRARQASRQAFRVIADHLRAASFAIADGVIPSNKARGYVLRRLIRRAVRQGRILEIDQPFTPAVAKAVVKTMKEPYPELKKKEKIIFETLRKEELKFGKALARGLKEIKKQKILDGKFAFYLYETYGFPWEMTREIAQERGQEIDKEIFEKEFKKHQELSRKGAIKKFAGGLVDHSEKVKKLHTATHLLYQALRQVLGPHIKQAGSNITSERLRFDFTHPQKTTPKQIKKTERLVNKKIKDNLKVSWQTMPFSKAKKEGALYLLEKKYPEKVKVYSIGNPARGGQVFSKEICGGPHVDFTGELGRFKIKKEESVAGGIRRIYGVLKTDPETSPESSLPWRPARVQGQGSG